MQDFEKLGALYLGRVIDPATKKPQEELILYDSKDLVTHAVCVGMTGSGKTGLCIDLIEEAAIDGVPAILIDPKGDLANLLLTFPSLSPADFLPWINEDDARQKNMTPESYAAEQAAKWKKGLEDSGQNGERIQKLKDAADFRIYTPASNAGFPVSILKSFAAPPPALLEDNELLRERISTTVTSLLGLIGIEADPVQSREHILLSTILNNAWRTGHDLDLEVLIEQVQTPPVTKIGVLNVDAFYPPKERFQLVMALNNLLASPGFSAWLVGEPLDITNILYTAQGKPRIAIFSIAHLSDAERMFFVSLLLNQVISWMRGQSGTSSLRALVYMDEIFGYLPPTANPPSKLPMLTLLKQARAFGVGLVLVTQNQVDLDYKALSNAGTWFIGRLQTERDKLRLLDGLEGAAATAKEKFSRSKMDKILSGLQSRMFLMSNAHEDEPVLMTTRWAMSYLRGPLTRDQIKRLMDPVKKLVAPHLSSKPQSPEKKTITPGTPTTQVPSLPIDVPAYYVPVAGSSEITYQPRLLGVARINYSDTKLKINAAADAVFLTPIKDAAIPVDWKNAQKAGFHPNTLEKNPRPDAKFGNIPPAASIPKNYAEWSKDFANWLFSNEQLTLYKNPVTGEVSSPGESEQEFKIRLGQGSRENRDELVAKLRAKYTPQYLKLQEKLKKAQSVVERENAQSKEKGIHTAVKVGGALLSAFTGRKLLSQTNLNKASTAIRGVSSSAAARKEYQQAVQAEKDLQQQLTDLQAQFDAELAAMHAKGNTADLKLESLVIKPKKTDIDVQLVTLVWAQG
ncbi:MAG: hypothetical protein JW704_06990 [Anaerolineaceae bacterium]|nr:hypothetical protein [Anaerolineaceae bacterium]